MDELKPCPFCGGKATIGWIPVQSMCKRTKGNLSAFCSDCLTHSLVGSETKEQAKNAWNNRVEKDCSVCRFYDDEPLKKFSD